MTYQKLNREISLYASQITSLLGISILGIGLISVGYLLPQLDNPFVIIAITAAILFIALAINRPEIATLAFAFILYGNITGIVTQVYGLPRVIAGSFFLLLIIPLVNYIWVRREKLIIDTALVLMCIFLFFLLVSSFLVAKDMGIAGRWITIYVTEGLILYFLIINVVRNLNVLKRVIWMLMITGILTGGLSLYQALTNSYDQQFGGLAQRKLHSWTSESSKSSGYDPFEEDNASPKDIKIRNADRASGSINSKNRYGQNMVMLLPLCFFIFWQERSSRTKKIMALVAVLLTFSGMMLSYSRGAFVTFIVLLGVMIFMGQIRIRTVLVGILLIVTLINVVAPGYFGRMETIFTVSELGSENPAETERSIRGRTTAMLAAWSVFLDHPILGVGPGQYTAFYSVDYMSDPDIAFRQINTPRRAHNLYVELAAETGLLGFSIFMAIIILALFRLLQARRRWINSRPDLAALATAFFLTLIAYLGSSMFLHLAYQRFLWFMLGLAGATLQILNSKDPKVLLSK